MRRLLLAFTGSLAVVAGAAVRPAAQDPALATRPERTNFEETSRLEDVQRFVGALAARSDLLRVQTFGTSEQGRPLLLVTLSNPPVAHPRDLHALDRPIVLLQANIHGGEVEGKEAVQHLMRRLAIGDLRPVLDRLVVLIAPIYNVDGNEAISVENRTPQYGPIAGVGRRENAKGLDLNRDYTKLESPEARALVQLFTDWDPHVMVDLHTTNGSYHGYHLTYSIPLNLTLDPKLLGEHRDRMMPAIEKALLQRHKFRSYYYGNFSSPADQPPPRLRRSAEASAKAEALRGGGPKPGQPDTRTWRAFDHRPRAGQNYVGFRNRLTILSEAYSYLDFKTRIAVTEAFVEEILRYADAHSRDILALTKSLDLEFVTRARSAEDLPIGVAYEMRPLPKPVPILVGEVTEQVNPRNGRPMTMMVPDKYTTVMMQDFAVFAPTRSVPMARAYVLPREEAGPRAQASGPGTASSDGLRPIVANLRQHGITVEELTAPLTADVSVFTVGKVTKAERPFQGHHEVRLDGTYATQSATLAAGTIVVRLAQPLGRLAAYLLEPESDDGLVNWNFFDAWLAPGKPAPVQKIMTNVPMSTRRLEGF